MLSLMENVWNTTDFSPGDLIDKRVLAIGLLWRGLRVFRGPGAVEPGLRLV